MFYADISPTRVHNHKEMTNRVCIGVLYRTEIFPALFTSIAYSSAKRHRKQRWFHVFVPLDGVARRKYGKRQLDRYIC